MARGYTGVHARRYFAAVNTSFDGSKKAIDGTPTHISGVTKAQVVEAPYTESDGYWYATSVTGTHSSANISYDISSSQSYQSELHRFCSAIEGELSSRVNELHEMTNDLQLPQATPQVNLIITKLSLMIPRFIDTTRRTEALVESHASNILNGDEGVTLNQAEADGYRGEFAERGIVALQNAIELYVERGAALEIPQEISSSLQVSDMVDYWEAVEYLLTETDVGGHVSTEVVRVFKEWESWLYP